MSDAQAPPERGSRWKRPHWDRTVRVLGVVDGWVVFRVKGAAPLLIHVNEFSKLYVPAPLPPKKPREAPAP